jgi:ubiquinone/menaquinone biosynthesis C-methylase UbiE
VTASPTATRTTVDFAEHFTQLGVGYDEHAFSRPGLSWVSHREVAIVTSALADLPARASVLDAGAGNGRFTRALVDELHLDVTALDMLPVMLDSIRDRVPSAKTVLGRLGQPLPFADATFDAAVAVRVLKYVPQWTFAIRELARVLRPGGRLILEMTNRRSASRLGYHGAPITLCSIHEIETAGTAMGFEWSCALPGSHLPQPVWSRADGGLLKACTGAQRVLDRTFRAVGARNVFFVGRRRR